MLSIIVPVYNVEKYIRQCIDSILAQTYRDFELILVDDGSHDKCPKICDEYAARNSHIKVIHKKNGGAQSAVREGVLASCGEYIGFVDSDDWVEPDMYETLMGLVKQLDLDCIICNFKHYNNDTGKFSSACVSLPEGLYSENTLQHLYEYILPSWEDGHYLSPVRWNKIFRREMIYDCIINADTSIAYGEDMIVVVPALLRCKSVYFIRKDLYVYRKSDSSITGGDYREQYLSDHWKVFEMLLSYQNVLHATSVYCWFFHSCISSIAKISNSKRKFSKKRTQMRIVMGDERVRKILSIIKGKLRRKRDKLWYYVMKYKLTGLINIYFSIKRLKKNRN